MDDVVEGSDCSKICSWSPVIFRIHYQAYCCVNVLSCLSASKILKTLFREWISMFLLTSRMQFVLFVLGPDCKQTYFVDMFLVLYAFGGACTPTRRPDARPRGGGVRPRVLNNTATPKTINHLRNICLHSATWKNKNRIYKISSFAFWTSNSFTE